MSGKIPRDPDHCAVCFKLQEPCDDHSMILVTEVLKTKEYKIYDGPDVYEPSDWVKSVVGHKYKSYDGVYECFGYDPRCGFWMRMIKKNEIKSFAYGTRKIGDITNVSERAIDRTFTNILENE